MGFVAGITQRRQDHESHEQNAHYGSSRQHPSKTLDLGFAVAVEHDSDLVIQLLNL